MWDKLIEEMSWYDKIKVLRIARGLSQEEIAKKCMTNQKAWWNWESGKSYPRKINRHAIAKALDVDIKDIFEEESIEEG